MPGDLDPTFGVGGRVATDFDNDTDAVAGMTIQANGKIIAVGFACVPGGDCDAALARYNVDGSLGASAPTGRW